MMNYIRRRSGRIFKVSKLSELLGGGKGKDNTEGIKRIGDRRSNCAKQAMMKTTGRQQTELYMCGQKRD